MNFIWVLIYWTNLINVLINKIKLFNQVDIHICTNQLWYPTQQTLPLNYALMHIFKMLHNCEMLLNVCVVFMEYVMNKRQFEDQIIEIKSHTIIHLKLNYIQVYAYVYVSVVCDYQCISIFKIITLFFLHPTNNLPCCSIDEDFADLRIITAMWI